MEDKKQKQAERASRGEEEDEDEDEENTASRFVSRLLRFLFKGCRSKDKVIRFRVVQCIAEMVAHLGEVKYVHRSDSTFENYIDEAQRRDVWASARKSARANP